VREQKQHPSLPAKELAQAVNPTVDPRQRQLEQPHSHQSKLPAHIVSARASPNARQPPLQVIDISVRVAQDG